VGKKVREGECEAERTETRGQTAISEGGHRDSGGTGGLGRYGKGFERFKYASGGRERGRDQVMKSSRGRQGDIMGGGAFGGAHVSFVVVLRGHFGGECLPGQCQRVQDRATPAKGKAEPSW